MPVEYTPEKALLVRLQRLAHMKERGMFRTPPKGGETLIVGPDLELERAILNHELYWRKCEPNNDARFRNSLPVVTKEQLQAIKTERQKPFLKGKT